MDVTVSAEIDRPTREVAEFAMNPENEPRWIGGIKSARLLTPPPVGVGTQVERVAAFLGKRFSYVLQAEEYEPGRKVVMTTVRGPFPMRVTYSFDAVGDGTRVTNRVQGDTGGFYRLAGPLMKQAVKRSLTRDLATLKRLLEGAGLAKPPKASDHAPA
jgi:carbon monoxide dehydrogenase subunit G